MDQVQAERAEFTTAGNSIFLQQLHTRDALKLLPVAFLPGRSLFLILLDPKFDENPGGVLGLDAEGDGFGSVAVARCGDFGDPVIGRSPGREIAGIFDMILDPGIRDPATKLEEKSGLAAAYGGEEFSIRVLRIEAEGEHQKV